MEKRYLPTHELVLRLQELDLMVYATEDEHEPVSMVIVGGAAFMLAGLTDRTTTHDIDVIVADTAIARHMSDFEEMNTRCSVFLDCLPYGFEDRLMEIELGLSSITVLRPSLEDLVVMKLRASRGHDMEDITSQAVLSLIDWGLLDTLVYDPDEAQASCMSDIEYLSLTYRYKDYRRKYRGTTQGGAAHDL